MSPIARLTLLFLALAVGACSSSANSMDSGLAYYDTEPSMEKATTHLSMPGMTVSEANRLPFNLGDGGWEDSVSVTAEPTAFINDFDVEAAETPPAAPATVERLLVYSGRFQVAAGDIDQALDDTKAMAKDLGGYFQSLSDHTITIRVPARRWDEALARVAGIGRILNRQIDAADVTEEVVDLKLRLRNARALGKRLEELLDLAKTVEETLKVETELNRIRTEIERIEGRLQFLSDRVAFSTLVIMFTEAATAPTRLQALPFPWLRDLGLNNLLGLPGGVR